MSDTTTVEPLFKIIKGNPTHTEIAALTAVLTQIVAAAKSTRIGENNMWGRRDPYRRDHLFNPNAFRNVTFY